MAKRLTQNKAIIDYVSNHDGLTALEAFTKLGIVNLTARIHELEVRGYVFSKYMEEVPSRYNNTTRVTRYRLIGKESNVKG